ncbi:AMP-binding protein [Streptomyces jumonjinensis]|uniref:AMP-binding protein n=1 Tax=Streptomyces jumonjinensis TaxID=1945 RepID=UPI0037AB8750
MNSRATAEFRSARDVLLRHRTDPETARRAFRWPRPACFNWALDWFDAVAAEPALRERTALRIVTGSDPADDRTVGWGELARRSARTANWLRGLGVRRGDPVLLLLGNREELWETMLAAIKLGAVLVPAYTSLTPVELADRIVRADVRCVVADASLTGRFATARPRPWTGIAVGGGSAGAAPGWIPYGESRAAPSEFRPDGPTRADDPLLRYFTSGTTSRPKLVEHTHTSYPIGHLSGMYWNGLLPGDRHFHVSAPGWAKHAWSSFFVPWNAEATVVAVDSPAAARPETVLEVLRTRGITSFCAPPTVWRGLLAAGPGERPAALREAVSAGEPLEPGLVRGFQDAWGVAVRDGFGQTETTGLIGQPPGRAPVPGVLGRPLPGYRVALLDPATGRTVPDGAPGELCIDLAERPAGLMRGYADDPGRTAEVFADGHYHSGDLMVRSPDGSLRHLGRADDLFLSFGHRVSPGELEAALLRQPEIAEAAVVPVADPVGLWVPKAYVVPAPGIPADATTAARVFAGLREELSPELRVRLLEFHDTLPRTHSGKLRRAGLRGRGPGPGGEHREGGAGGAG